MLGPLLLLIYDNYIYKSSDKLNFLFADGTTLLFAHKNLKVREQVVNSELSEVSASDIFCPSLKRLNKHQNV